MHRITNILFLLLILAVPMGSGCSMFRAPKPPPATAAELPALSAAPYHEQALSHLREGRSFMAQGRYELARESYLLALAAADNGDMRTLAAKELETADRMIKSVR